MKTEVIVVSGYFNPGHKCHIEYFNIAEGKGDYLVVVLNNDHKRAFKGFKEFQKENERVSID
jgi:cytidyltransferase-like protein